MSKLYKVVVFVPDLNNDFDNIASLMGKISWHIDFAKVFPEGEVEIEWDDDIDINQRGASRADYEAYFKSEESEEK